MNANSNCDGGHCSSEAGEVRVLPLGTNPDHGNLILCRSCFEHELRYRRERNLELASDCQYRLPTWESLTVYGEPSEAVRIGATIEAEREKADDWQAERQALGLVEDD